MKHLKHLSLLFFAAFAFAACSDDEDNYSPATTVEPVGQNGAFVLNQGNQYAAISSSCTLLDFKNNTQQNNFFSTTNGIEMGHGVQDGVIHGSKLYLAMHGSNLVWVIDRKTGKKTASVSTSSPEGITAHGGYVYVTNNDGFVSKIDTLAYTVVEKIEVGPNPVDMEVRNGRLYATVSDGYNYLNKYVNGFKVACIDLATFKKTADIRVGMNPSKMTQDAHGNIFVTCMGDYNNVKPKIWKLDAQNHASEFIDGSIAQAHADRLYVIGSSQSDVYAVFDSRSGKAVTTLFGKGHTPLDPVAMAVRPSTGEIFVTSRGSLDPKIRFTHPGHVLQYDKDGNFVRRYDVGIEPYAILFF